MKISLPIIDPELRVIIKTLAANLTSGILDGSKINHLNADYIDAGSIDADIINVTNLNADNITAGTLTGRTIKAMTVETGANIWVDSSDGKIKIRYGDVEKGYIAADASRSLVINSLDNIYLLSNGDQMAHFTANSMDLPSDYYITWAGQGRIRSTGGYLKVEGSTGGVYDLRVEGTIYPDADRGHDLGSSDKEFNGIYGHDLHLTGDAWADSWNINSDIKVKKNITQLTSVINKILQIRGVQFDYKKNNKHSIGLIAQEVEAIFPEIVSEVNRVVDDGIKEEYIDENGFTKYNIIGKKWEKIKTVDYSKLIPVLIEAIREQQEQINELKNALNKPKNDEKN